MKHEMEARLLTIYLNSTDQWHGHSLYSAIVQLCEEKGIAGATVLRCLEGYGVHRRLHTTRLLELSENLPIRVEVVDAPEKIDAILPNLEQMITEGFMTIAPIRAVRFTA